ncbi:MAG: conjugal transfer protein TraL [Rhodospirillaceae bacterium]|jgi:hypothetical protein|nr:conjugal transfer protein TraL [Rhodospirillaceae bacterium]MBT5243161.1 conjugal transfer protein TraL [Rhodospirillaceae bacterium]MBT5563386.1 conjugal transfer protein TraL [Rhodospirillaceae bacterium]MBT6243700.1 conjugal transfer protein TraL [Rhodospirillaceae bacterium]MBT7136999.1 conjugal transfer protein TraL [Rhodospirillaceae bacterium]
MATINFVLQGKGGVGKSLVASLLTQHYMKREIATICFDTDPVNKTFASYNAFNVRTIDILNDGIICVQEFDNLVETLIEAPEDSAVIIDNGASTFLPLCAYLNDNDVVPFLEKLGHSVMFHSVVTGGQALIDTMSGLEALFVNFPDTPATVWLNEYFGKTEMNGTTFSETKLCNNPKHKIHALITIAELNKHTFGYDFENMLKKRLSFAEALADPKFTIMTRQRLVMTWRAINEQITQANL